MGGESTSIGVLVPIVKSNSSGEAPPDPAPPLPSSEEQEVDKDVLCPICMQIIKDAFLTACGHSFCYMCIFTHLQNKSDCPCCSHFLTASHLYPNFLLNKLLMKTSAHQIAKTATPLAQLRQALEQGCEASVKELESLLSLLAEKKIKMEQEEAETNLQIMLDFLHCLRKKKLDELTEIQADLMYIKEDIHAVERRRIELYRRRDKYSATMRMLTDEPSSKTVWPSLISKNHGMSVSRTPLPAGQCPLSSGGSENRKGDAKSSASYLTVRKDVHGGSETQNLNQSGLALARKRRVHAQFNDLQDCYLQKRRYWARLPPEQRALDLRGLYGQGYSEGLEDFQSVLSTFTRYSRLRVVAELRHGALFHSPNIVSSSWHVKSISWNLAVMGLDYRS